MPVLDNPKHERFAQLLAKGKTQADAYVEAGYKPSEPHASRLASSGKVAARVQELQERAAEKAEWTAADRLRMLADIAAATQAGDPRVAVSAIAEANKMQGSHAPLKQDHTSSDGSISAPTVIQIVGAVAPDDDSPSEATH